MQNTIITEIDERKYKIVKFLSELYIISAIIAFLSYFILFFIARERFEPMHYYIWIFIILFLIGSAYLRFYLIAHNAKRAYIAIAIMMLIPAFLIIFTSGTGNAISFVLIITVLVSGSIIFGVEKIHPLFAFVIFAYGLTYVLHKSDLIQVVPETTETDFANTVMLTFFVWIIIKITKIGYEEIEYSYNKAIESAKALEELNKNLDKRVKLRTKQLEKSFNEKADSIHSEAIVGAVAKPLIHDISSPLSSIKIALQSVSKKSLNKQNSGLLDIALNASTQMERIIVNGRILMQKKELYSEFFPTKTISQVVEILDNEISRYGIEITQDIPDTLKLVGSEVIFERMIINILLNAIEELKEKGKKKLVAIRGYREGKYLVICITDSGRGLSKDLLKEIFSPDFTLKQESGNLGMGLPFVKSTIEQKFGGNISATSKVGKFTTFELRFDTTFSDKTDKKSQRIPNKH